MKQITEAMFVACTGRKPELDDMERVNCPKQGEVGHFHCGWNWVQSAPVFAVGRPEIEKPYRLHDCECGHSWEAEVKWGVTQHLTGEVGRWCPKCGKRAAMSSPIFMRSTMWEE